MLVQQLSSSGHHVPFKRQDSRPSWRWHYQLTLLTCTIYSFSLFSQQLSLAFIIPIFPQLFWDKIIAKVGIPRGILKNCSTVWTYNAVIEKPEVELKKFSCVSIDADSPEWTLVLNGTFLDLYNHVVLRVGVLGAAPSLSYLFLVPFARPLIRRIGACAVTLIGSLLVICALLPPLFEVNLASFIITRLFHGIGFVFVIVGMTARATTLAYGQRDKYYLPAIMTTAGSCGAAIGPVIGGGLYQVIDLRLVYCVIGSFILLDIAAQASIYDKDFPPILFDNPERMCSILKDWYAILGLISLALLSSITALVTVFVPLWLIEMLDLPSWQLGLVIFPTMISQRIGNVFSSLVGSRFDHWKIDLTGFLLFSISVFLLPLATKLYQVLLIMTLIGLAQGITAAALIPLMTKIVDRRHDGAYIILYDLTERADQLGLLVGPMTGVGLLRLLTFPWVLRVFSIILFLWAFFQIGLRNPPSTMAEKKNDENIETSLRE